jgi:hypothetical protein
MGILPQAFQGEVRARIVRNLVPSRGVGLAIVSMEQEHRARLDRWLKILAAEVEPAPPPQIMHRAGHVNLAKGKSSTILCTMCTN